MLRVGRQVGNGGYRVLLCWCHCRHCAPVLQLPLIYHWLSTPAYTRFLNFLWMPPDHSSLVLASSMISKIETGGANITHLSSNRDCLRPLTELQCLCFSMPAYRCYMLPSGVLHCRGYVRHLSPTFQLALAHNREGALRDSCAFQMVLSQLCAHLRSPGLSIHGVSGGAQIMHLRFDRGYFWAFGHFQCAPCSSRRQWLLSKS
mmetsp:Transcript_7785/g.10371  ORF Transcript_7785/g.10371 Transcript_7785/m.10371 type:complete len:203 (+) Transcript_7785:473-1081(+)